MKNLKKISSIDLYLLFSLGLSLGLFAWSHYYLRSDWRDQNFAVGLVLGHFLMFRELYGRSFYFQRSSVYSSVFLFQVLCLVGLSFEMNVLGGLYMALIPAFMGQYYALRVDREFVDSKMRQRSGIGFLMLPLLAFAIYSSFFPYSISLIQEMPFFLAFAIWSLVTLYSGTTLFSMMSNKWKSLVGEDVEHFSVMDRDRADRLFFHDVINQTHGINLFLSSRISRNESVSVSQAKELLSEMRIIQAQIKDHYKFTHKNLVNSYEWASLVNVRKWIERTVDSFLPSDFVHTEIHFHHLDTFSGTIHYPSFTRIFTNIIKNASEVKTHDVSIVFECKPRGISFVVRNVLFEQDRKVSDLELKLRDQILNGERNPIIQGESGLGLESIQKLCAAIGGDFDFYIQDGQWVTTVYLPYQFEQYEDRRAA